MSAEVAAHHLRGLLRGAGFRRLLAVRLTTQLADGAFEAALATLFFFSPEQASTPAGVAVAFAALTVPFTLVGPWAGVPLDRWSRRNTLVVGNALRCVLALGVAALMAGSQPGPLLYVVVLAFVSVNRFLLAALSAGLPHVVPRADLILANAITPTLGTAATAVGVSCAYVAAVAGVPHPVVVAAAAVVLAVATGLALRLRRDQLGPHRAPTDDAPPHDAPPDNAPPDNAPPDNAPPNNAPPDNAPPDRATPNAATPVGPVPLGVERLGLSPWAGVAAEMVSGLRHLRARHTALAALEAMAGHRFLFGAATLATILISRSSFGRSDAGLAASGAVVAAAGVGFAAAAVSTPPWVRRSGPERVGRLGLLAAALTLAVWAVRLPLPVLLGGATVIGWAGQTLKICVDTIVQRDVADAFRGRVFSLYDVLFNAAFVIAMALTALVIPAAGYSRGLFGLLALGYLALVALYRRTGSAG